MTSNCIVCNNIVVYREEKVPLCKTGICSEIYSRIVKRTLLDAKNKSNMNSKYYYEKIKELENL